MRGAGQARVHAGSGSAPSSPPLAPALQVYEDFAVTVAAMPVVAGRKSRLESFAGAQCTYTIEAMMGDRRALQAGTSHNLGDNFAKAFGTRYLDEGGELRYVHQSSWGVSTRMVGGVIMTHGDDAGLRLPPRLAPVQVCRCVCACARCWLAGWAGGPNWAPHQALERVPAAGAAPTCPPWSLLHPPPAPPSPPPPRSRW